MIFHDPDFLVPPQALGALRAVRGVRVRSAGPDWMSQHCLIIVFGTGGKRNSFKLCVPLSTGPRCLVQSKLVKRLKPALFCSLFDRETASGEQIRIVSDRYARAFGQFMERK